MVPELVIFDCDGVLVDSEPISSRVLAEALTAAGLPTSQPEARREYQGLLLADIAARAEARLGRPLPDDWGERFEADRAEAFRSELTPVPGAAEAVARVAGAGIGVCVASQGSVEKIRLTLGLTGLLDLFAAGALFSAYAVTRGKPHPDLVLHAAATMGADPARCVVVEDTPSGVIGAVAAGMRVFGLAAVAEDEPALRSRGRRDVRRDGRPAGAARDRLTTSHPDRERAPGPPVQGRRRKKLTIGRRAIDRHAVSFLSVSTPTFPSPPISGSAATGDAPRPPRARHAGRGRRHGRSAVIRRSPPLPRAFADDQALLEAVLAEVIRADPHGRALELHDRTVALARRAREGDEVSARHLGELVGALDVEDAEVLVRSLTRWFQLINLAEDNDRVRRLRSRELAHDVAGRPGSLRDAVRRLAAAGVNADQLGELLAGAELRLVLTAHPTEARRRTTLEKLARIFAVLRDLDERPHRPGCRGPGPHAPAGHGAGAVGLRRAARRRADGARRGTRRARVLRVHARRDAARSCTAISRRRSPSPTRRRACTCRRSSASAPGSAAIATATRT